ncbi:MULTISPECIES: CoA-binding protein [Deferrisoma]
MRIEERIQRFLASGAFGVIGASRDRRKYGNKVLRCYRQAGRRVVPVHPREAEIEGLPCVGAVADLPREVQSLSLVTPPQVTEEIVEQAIRAGIPNLWMQPGAESPAAVARAEAAGLNVIADGSCVLVVLGFREDPGG